MKKCKKCGLDKAEADYRFNATGRGLRLECRQCERDLRRKYYSENPEKFCEASRKWSKNNPEKRNATKREWYARNTIRHHDSRRKRMYGVSEIEIDGFRKSQGNACAICFSGFVEGLRTTTFHVDHNHVTGKVRGLLCGKCNSALGFLNDSFSLCVRAADYLRRNSA